VANQWMKPQRRQIKQFAVALKASRSNMVIPRVFNRNSDWAKSVNWQFRQRMPGPADWCVGWCVGCCWPHC